MLPAGRDLSACDCDLTATDYGHLAGFWVGISQLPWSHPWTVRWIWRLHQLGLFSRVGTVD